MVRVGEHCFQSSMEAVIHSARSLYQAQQARYFHSDMRLCIELSRVANQPRYHVQSMFIRMNRINHAY
jgi:hypothetical protein